MPKVVTYKFNPICVQRFMDMFKGSRVCAESNLILDRENSRGLFTTDLLVKEKEGVLKLPDSSNTYYGNPQYMGGYVFRLSDLRKCAGNKKSGYALIRLKEEYLYVKDLWKMLYVILPEKIGYVDVWKLSTGMVYGFGSDYGFIVSTTLRYGFDSDSQKVFCLDELAIKLGLNPPDKDELRNWEREIFGSVGI